jgi:energy-coupling factor transport system substrate-specific component
MSWQLGAFSILGLALAGGFAWYERSRPDARIVALVATLAAFAALGRIAFAALPNVKPTTDIVLVSGYALGGAPGFAVGALAGLTSNFFFGQGPWTPWQMAAWGVTGIIGAALVRPTRGRIGRWPLALVCGVVGYAFAAMQDVGDWVTYSDHSLSQLGVYVGKGTGFDFVHAAGCVAFALAFGPALTRSLQRFGRRLQVVWGEVGSPRSAATRVALLVILMAGTITALGVGPGGPGLGGAGETAAAAGTPTGYLLAAQHRDGGFGSSPAAASAQLYAGWAALGLAAEGHNPQDVRHGGRSLLDYIRAGAGGGSDPGSLERTILAARAAGVSVRQFGGRDLVARLEHDIRADGSVSDQVDWTSFAVLALRAAGVSAPARTLSWLIRQQDRDGGFSFATAGAGSDVDDTGSALQALAGAPGAGSARSRAVRFIRRQQNRDGGMPALAGGQSNAQSTAWAVQGLIAAGIDPGSLRRRGAVSPLQFLQSLIGPDGHVHYSRTSDQTPVWVTSEALMALARKSLPLAAVPRAHRGTRSGRAAAASVRTHRSSSSRHPGTGHQSAARAQARSSSALLGYATDAGLAVALVLAPIGLG